MNVIYKYPLAIQRTQPLAVPRDAKILTVQNQNGVPTLWVMLEPRTPAYARTIHMVGTGHGTVDPSLVYIGTTQNDGFVWHWFENPLDREIT